ncbi:unnamed protein product [Timema podura]|uniref:DNA/RNA non-specific endonuclease/pyrophosphatase/phosphodiesterase domain-containing protein n=1 Tax=Timema podura TaxID=61482 RepID=A0ABN7NL68_TIMPD|nr:unnamed protein product [Timema podura]
MMVLYFVAVIYILMDCMLILAFANVEADVDLSVNTRTKRRIPPDIRRERHREVISRRANSIPKSFEWEQMPILNEPVAANARSHIAHVLTRHRYHGARSTTFSTTRDDIDDFYYSPTHKLYTRHRMTLATRKYTSQQFTTSTSTHTSMTTPESSKRSEPQKNQPTTASYKSTHITPKVILPVESTSRASTTHASQQSAQISGTIMSSNIVSHQIPSTTKETTVDSQCSDNIHHQVMCHNNTYAATSINTDHEEQELDKTMDEFPFLDSDMFAETETTTIESKPNKTVSPLMKLTLTTPSPEQTKRLPGMKTMDSNVSNPIQNSTLLEIETSFGDFSFESEENGTLACSNNEKEAKNLEDTAGNEVEKYDKYKDGSDNARCFINMCPRLEENFPVLMMSPCKKFLLPKYKEWLERCEEKTLTFVVNHGQQIIAECPGHMNGFMDLTTSITNVTCVDGDMVLPDNKGRLTFHCFNPISETVYWTGESCGPGLVGLIVRIGWKVGKKFRTTIKVCHHEKFSSNLYTIHELYGTADREKELSIGERPPYHMDDFYQHLDIKSFYEKGTQFSMLKRQLGSSDLAEKYLDPKNDDLVLICCEMAPVQDFLFNSWQQTAYHYINTAPMWKSIYQGNWRIIEETARAYAKRWSLERLEVWTGTYEVLKLPNKNGGLVPIYLSVDAKDKNKYIEVPKYFWKILYDALSNSGVAIVVSNNPFISKEDREQRLCSDDISHKINKWLEVVENEPDKGLVHCCVIMDLITKIPDLPSTFLKKDLTNLDIRLFPNLEVKLAN